MINFIEMDNVKKFIESTYKHDEILKVKAKLLRKVNFNPLEFNLLLIGIYHDSKLPAPIRLFAFYFLFLEEDESYKTIEFMLDLINKIDEAYTKEISDLRKEISNFCESHSISGDFKF